MPIYKLDVSPRPNSQLLCSDSQNQKQVKQPESLGGERRGKGALSPDLATGPAHQLPKAGPHVEGDSQREEVGGEVAEDAFQVVQVAPLAAAVRVGPDEVTAVRSVQATHITTLQEKKEGGTSGVDTPRMTRPGPSKQLKITSFNLASKPSQVIQVPTVHFNF